MLVVYLKKTDSGQRIMAIEERPQEDEGIENVVAWVAGLFDYLYCGSGWDYPEEDLLRAYEAAIAAVAKTEAVSETRITIDEVPRLRRFARWLDQRQYTSFYGSVDSDRTKVLRDSKKASRLATALEKKYLSDPAIVATANKEEAKSEREKREKLEEERRRLSTRQIVLLILLILAALVAPIIYALM